MATEFPRYFHRRAVYRPMLIGLEIINRHRTTVETSIVDLMLTYNDGPQELRTALCQRIL